MEVFFTLVLLTIVSQSLGCQDDNAECGAWAERGECDKNPGYMLNSCKSSCGACDGGSACKDVFTNCDENAAKGYCKGAWVDWMEKNCCETCKKTEGKATEVKETACSDKLGDCKQYVEWGYCTRQYVQYMKDNCCASCNAVKVVAEESKGKENKGSRDKESACLASANSYRAKHRNTAALEWDPVLAEKAQRYAEKLLADGLRIGGDVWQILNHDPENKVGEGMGENLYYQDNWKTGDDPFYCEKADESWYAEIKDYSFSTGRSRGGVVTHFTQMVWRNSVKVGYGVAVDDSPKYKGNKLAVVVAKYTPKGNWGDDAEFRKNVQYTK